MDVTLANKNKIIHDSPNESKLQYQIIKHKNDIEIQEQENGLCLKMWWNYTIDHNKLKRKGRSTTIKLYAFEMWAQRRI